MKDTSESPATLPWLDAALRNALRSHRAHALLIHGPQGVGQFELALAVAQASLCEQAPPGSVACGRCAGCHLVRAHSHPDLWVVLPEALRPVLGWGANDDDEGPDRATKAKPSREIKVEAVRTAVAFAQTTSARGHGKVIVLHPAERMNAIAANTLLKTLEEPPGQARLVLSCAAPQALLPTIRSRCQSVAVGLPGTEEAVAWLVQQGVDQPDVLLAATGGQPQLALEWAQQGSDAALWARLPALVRQGQAAPLAAWPLPRLVDALQKLCHDAACRAVGAQSRYFPPEAVAAGADLRALATWRQALDRVARHADHPWNAGLMAESLVQQGQRATAARGTARSHGSRDQQTTPVSVHSGR